MRYILRATRCVRLAEESLDLLAILELDGADSERGRNAVDEAAERFGRELPDLDFDPAPARFPHHPRARRRESRERVQAVLRRGAARAHQACAALGQLVVERQAGQMRAADGKLDAALSVRARNGSG